MKTRQFLKEVRERAKAQGLSLDFVRAGREHDLYRVGSVQIAVPRHGELGPKLEFEMRKELEPVFGERWWR
jgi:hypothetical protein